MCDLFRSLGNSLDLVDVLSTFDRELRGLVGYDGISVHLLEGPRLVPAYAAGDGIANRIENPEEMSLLLSAAASGQPSLHELELIFPVETPTAAIAILALYRRCAPCFSDHDLDLLDVVGAKLAVSIENAREFQLAVGCAAEDPVTGFANRRALFQRLDAELARARRGGTRLAVLQCTLGGFAEADRLISPELIRHAFQKIAQRIRESCREYDFPARSGDDLMLLLPGFGPSDFEAKQALLQTIVEEAGCSVGLPLFAMLGAAFYPEDGRDTEDLLAEAARRLNWAKLVGPGGSHVDGHS